LGETKTSWTSTDEEDGRADFRSDSVHPVDGARSGLEQGSFLFSNKTSASWARLTMNAMGQEVLAIQHLSLPAEMAMSAKL
jgi:hypothetical protein